MPNARNLTELSVVIESVHDSVGPEQEFANLLIPVFGDNATQPGKFLQPIRVLHQFVPERHRTLGIVAGDEDSYVMEVVTSSGRPD